MRSAAKLGLIILSLGIASVAHATTGCNAVGWDQKHGMTGCTLYYPAVQWMYDEGIASGDAATGKFHPERPINRAEFTKLVLLSSGVEDPPACTESPFPDVPKDAWFAPYICAAKSRGIISGFPDGYFRPAIDVNFANGAKILAKTFVLPTDPSDANISTQGFPEQPSVWYRPYTQALLKKKAVAPTIRTFDQSILRGEMAEMLYRLVTGNNYFEKPLATGDGDFFGYGFTGYELEELFSGLYLSANPQPPLAFTPLSRFFSYIFTTNVTLKGYAFSHVLQLERCSLSGLWEHCKPTYTDWSLQLFRGPALRFRSDYGPVQHRMIAGKQSDCLLMGVEGENTEFCIVPIASKQSLVIVRDFIDTNVMEVPGATSREKSDEIYEKFLESISFATYGN